MGHERLPSLSALQTLKSGVLLNLFQRDQNGRIHSVWVGLLQEVAADCHSENHHLGLADGEVVLSVAELQQLLHEK